MQPLGQEMNTVSHFLGILHIAATVLMVAALAGCDTDRVRSSRESSRVAASRPFKVTGDLAFANVHGRRLAVLTVINESDKVLWIPRSDGDAYGCEAVSFNVGGQPSTHYDYARCSFPTDYSRLPPKASHRYVHRIPDEAKGLVEMSIWAPWRAENGERVDDATKRAAIETNAILVEEVFGAAVIQ